MTRGEPPHDASVANDERTIAPSGEQPSFARRVLDRALSDRQLLLRRLTLGEVVGGPSIAMQLSAKSRARPRR